MTPVDDDNDDDLIEDNGDLFREPDDFYEKDKPATFVNYVLQGGQVLNLRLVGHNPLWGHLLWNAGRVVSTLLEEHADRLVKDKTVLELGAGAGLPSLVSAMRGARKVVVSDYPDPDLIDNLRYNIAHCGLSISGSTKAEGYLWGSSPDRLLRHLDSSDGGFDLLILADILFNHSEHEKLVATLQSTLKRSETALALVFFTPYRPWLLQKDMHFFDLARNSGFAVEKILETVMNDLMFEDDPGDALLRRTVFGYKVVWGTP